jgi:lipopolysaccharide/colanic/teichoic acid biosynthesis glycosyltransferase
MKATHSPRAGEEWHEFRRQRRLGVMFVLPLAASEPLYARLARMAREGVRIAFIPYFPGRSGASPPQASGRISVFARSRRAWDPCGRLKRATDLLLGMLLLVAAGPVMAAITALVAIDSRGPVLFRQPRVGLRGRVFTILKFRTMHVHFSDLGATVQTSRGDRRVTRIGALLRRTSLDELPQLFNVIAGTMSLVGPRPHALRMSVEGIPIEDAVEGYALRYAVKPGITGLAQVSGSRGVVDTVDMAAERVDYDLQYIESWSPWLDLKILCGTALLIGADARAF